MKDVVVKLIAKEINLNKKEIENLIEVPPNDKLGDFAFPCFSLAKKVKKSPMVIAKELAQKF